VAACRMGLITLHYKAPAIDGVLPLFPAEGTKEEPGSVQFQIRNCVSHPNNDFKNSMQNMYIASQFTSPGKSGPLPGLDVVLHMGHDEQNHKYCDFYAECGRVRACLELLTDAKLTLFRHVFEAVTR
jgi:hypothetical protein